ncbi:MAG TPA: response regulator [Candidatus Dormibacteraeota bacterium]|nr:response regulator [Candidatus Dormibacteraeota bacterium]
MAKILIIEDDEVIRTAYTTIFTHAGYEVSEAEDGQQGLLKAEEVKPDLIILDILMPKMDGNEFLRRYDVINKHPEVKVVVLSNSTTATSIEETKKLGAGKYLVKSDYTPQKLVDLVTAELAAK